MIYESRRFVDALRVTTICQCFTSHDDLSMLHESRRFVDALRVTSRDDLSMLFESRFADAILPAWSAEYQSCLSVVSVFKADYPQEKHIITCISLQNFNSNLSLIEVTSKFYARKASICFNGSL